MAARCAGGRSVEVLIIRATTESKKLGSMAKSVAIFCPSAEAPRVRPDRGTALASVGLVVGLVSASLPMRLLSSLLFGVSPFDPLTFAAVVSALGLVALVATRIPARHATKVGPMSALGAD